jgi:mono/diheme cytochrome c family protein
MERKHRPQSTKRRSRASALLGAAALLALLPAMAEGAAAADPNAVKGLVADNCSRCHFVPPYSKSGLKSLNAPPFKEIANNPGVYTEARIRTFLQKPHYPMEPIILSRRDIDNLVAFIHTLRDR